MLVVQARSGNYTVVDLQDLSQESTVNRKWRVERLSVSKRKVRGSPRQCSISGYDTGRLAPFQYNSYHPSCGLKMRDPIIAISILYLATARFLLGGVVEARLKELAICLTR